MKKIIALSLSVLCAALSSCSNMSHAENRAVQGAAIGTAAGAIIGHQSGRGGEGALLGGAAGALGGYAVGRNGY